MNPDDFINALFDDLHTDAHITAPLLVIHGTRYTPEQVSALDMTTFTDDELKVIAGFQRTHKRQYIIMPKHDHIYPLVPADRTIVYISYGDTPDQGQEEE